jgi:hypothetical protein
MESGPKNTKQILVACKFVDTPDPQAQQRRGVCLTCATVHAHKNYVQIYYTGKYVKGGVIMAVFRHLGHFRGIRFEGLRATNEIY